MKIQRLEVHETRLMEAIKDIEAGKIKKPMLKGSKQVGTMVIGGVVNILVQNDKYKEVNQVTEAPVIKSVSYRTIKSKK